jgi:hypothetical protein
MLGRIMKKAIAVAAIVGVVLAASPALAGHDMVYAPCDPEDTRLLDEQVWYIDYQSGDMLRFDDPWWSERPSAYTNWRHQCLLGMSGVWQAAPIEPLLHPPTHTVESRDAIRATTTTVLPDPNDGSSSTTSTTSTTTTTTSTTTTTTQVVDDPLPPPDNDPIPGVDSSSDGGSGVVASNPAYDLYDAEWDDWPFEATVRLLEERYVPNTPNRYHFSLSAAVDYLRAGGMIAGLDHTWESP